MSSAIPLRLAAATLACAVAPSAFAASLSPFLFSDQTLDRIVLAVDRDGDGAANGPGETRVFFDASNASGLLAPAGNVFSIAQTGDGTVLIGDGGADSVYRLRDLDVDASANGPGEAAVWFSGQTNASGFRLNTPNGIAEGPDGAIYLVEADTNGSPTGDFVYRTTDLNGDGDANDAGEATVWLDLKALNPSSSPFTIRFDGDAAYVMDTAGATPNVIYRAQDLNGDAAIDAGEVRVFASDDAAFGASFDFAMDVASGSVWTWDWLPEGGVSSMFRLTDLDGSGAIDDAGEVAEAWNTTLLDPAYSFLAGFSMAANEATGEFLITSNAGADNGKWILRLLDLDGDGLFWGADESAIVLSKLDSGLYPQRPREIAFYAGPVLAPVPVPAAAPLLAFALAGLAALARRRV